MRRGWLLAVCCLIGTWACRSEIPSKAPRPEPVTDADPLPESAEGASVAERALGACENEDFSSCEYACRDAECFAWCAGEACAAALEQVVTCMEPSYGALSEAAALEADDQPDAAQERYAEYDTRWLDVCAPRCRQFIHDECERGICEDYWCDYGPRIGFEDHIASLLPTAPRKDPGAPQDSGNASTWGGSTLTMLRADRADAKEAAVSRLISGDQALAREVGMCVANPRPTGTRVKIAIHVARDGVPDRIAIQSSQAPAADACIRRRMQSFRLPRRVSDGFSDLRIELQARPDASGYGNGHDASADPWLDDATVPKPRKFAPPPPTADELDNQRKLDAGCKKLLATSPSIACAQAAPLAESVYRPLEGAGATLRTVENVDKCVSRLADLTVRCADDPDFAKVVERLTKKK